MVVVDRVGFRTRPQGSDFGHLVVNPHGPPCGAWLPVPRPSQPLARCCAHLRAMLFSVRHCAILPVRRQWRSSWPRARARSACTLRCAAGQKSPTPSCAMAHGNTRGASAPSVPGLHALLANPNLNSPFPTSEFPLPHPPPFSPERPLPRSRFTRGCCSFAAWRGCRAPKLPHLAMR